MFADRSGLANHSGVSGRRIQQQRCWLTLRFGGLGLLVIACLLPRLALAQPLQRDWEPATAFPCHLVVSEAFLNRFVARDQIEPTAIDDVILEAQVRGQLLLTTRLRLDLRPAQGPGLGWFVLDGAGQTATVGVTEQAAIHSRGRQQFRAVKPVGFDGRQFSTRHAFVAAVVQNQSLGASTQFDGTLLAPLANQVALRLAEQRREAAEAVARERVIQRVYSRFDQEVDQQLAAANGQLLVLVRERLDPWRLTPERLQTASTDDVLHVSMGWRLPSASEPLDRGGAVPTEAGTLRLPVDHFPPPQSSFAGPFGLSLWLHERQVNAWLERLNLAGRKTTDRELRGLDDQIRRLLGGQVDEAQLRGDDRAGMNRTALETEIEFAAQDPLRIRFQNEQVLVVIRATLRPAGQALLPPLLITVPFQVRSETDGWRLSAGEAMVEPQPTGGLAAPLPMVAKTLIQQSIRSSLPGVWWPRTLALPRWPESLPKLQLSSARADSGWGFMALDVAEQPTPGVR